MYQRSQIGKGGKPSAAQMQEMYARFNAWKDKFRDNIVDMGGKLKGGGKIVTSEGATNGQCVKAKEIIGGYMIVSAEGSSSEPRNGNARVERGSQGDSHFLTTPWRTLKTRAR
jgi:hypothetical protein